MSFDRAKPLIKRWPSRLVHMLCECAAGMLRKASTLCDNHTLPAARPGRNLTAAGIGRCRYGGRVALVPGQARVHALHTRLRGQNGRWKTSPHSSRAARTSIARALERRRGIGTAIPARFWKRCKARNLFAAREPWMRSPFSIARHRDAASTLLLSRRSESIRISAGSFRFAELGRDLGLEHAPQRSLMRSTPRTGVSSSMAQACRPWHGTCCQNGAGTDGSCSASLTAKFSPTIIPARRPALTGRGLDLAAFLGGELISLTTTLPDQDRVALAFQRSVWRERSRNARAGQFRRTLNCASIPTLDSFLQRHGRTRLGQAAHTAGRRIHLQPVATLQGRGALRIHVVARIGARPDGFSGQPSLPIWFREGMAGYLEKARGTWRSRVCRPTQIFAKPATPALARRAYAGCNGDGSRISFGATGESAVFDWAKRGVPVDVTKASISHATTNSK